MKKLVVIFSVVVAGATLFPSCNKNLKDDIRDLQQQLDEIENLIGSNEPISATTTFVDDNNVTRTIAGVYKFKASNAYTQSMTNNGDGTYDIDIQRFGDIWGNEGAWVEFTYNPTTKVITNKEGGQYWYDQDPYGDYVKYDGNNSPAPVITITVNSLNLATGDISLNFSAAGDAAYTSDVYDIGWAPNDGKTVSTTFSFAGKLKIFTTD